jgi:hypothetical protein
MRAASFSSKEDPWSDLLCRVHIGYEVLATYAGDLGNPLGTGEVPLVKVFCIDVLVL